MNIKLESSVRYKNTSLQNYPSPSLSPSKNPNLLTPHPSPLTPFPTPNVPIPKSKSPFSFLAWPESIKRMPPSQGSTKTEPAIQLDSRSCNVRSRTKKVTKENENPHPLRKANLKRTTNSTRSTTADHLALCPQIFTQDYSY
jgi:hypothetical protein